MNRLVSHLTGKLKQQQQTINSLSGNVKKSKAKANHVKKTVEMGNVNHNRVPTSVDDLPSNGINSVSITMAITIWQ